MVVIPDEVDTSIKCFFNLSKLANAELDNLFFIDLNYDVVATLLQLRRYGSKLIADQEEVQVNACYKQIFVFGLHFDF